MKEHNADRLRAALGRLPEYDPPTEAWAAINDRLKAATPSLADRLPSHQPPAAVWNAINRELSQAPAAAPARGRRLSARTWWSLAAGFLLVAAAAFTLLRGPAAPRVSYAYSQEAAPAALVDDFDDGEASFARAIAEIEARDEPTLNTLRHELDELTAAREEVKAMLVSYGEDPTIVRQLAAIERDRSDIYRRIIVEL